MILFHNDYSEGCHEVVLRQLVQTNREQTDGYGMDPYCEAAAAQIRMLCHNEDLAVHFLVGGTQTNLTIIDAALRPYQAVLGPESAHINGHETGAVEATGHKVLSVPSSDGKIIPEQIQDVVTAHGTSPSREHTVQPKMVYLSNPTEWGTLYSLKELEEISVVCRNNGLYLFLDGARLAYGLGAKGNDVTLEDLARLCDVFYIGGTKCGALFGEAVVIPNPTIAQDFRYMIKQHGGMLAKGRLLGIQFDALLKNGLYVSLGKYADQLADQIRAALNEAGCEYLVPTNTNQIFPILPADMRRALEQEFQFTDMGQLDENRHVVRICTSWATTQENTDLLCKKIKDYRKSPGSVHELEKK